MRVKSAGRVSSQAPGNPASRLLESVLQERPVLALLGTDASTLLADIDQLTTLLLDKPVRVVRVRGLPGVPLTLSRIVEEIGAGDRSGLRADDDELIVRVLATRSGDERQVALIVEQAELLPLRTLTFLQVALTVFGTRAPRLQLLFAGHPNFVHLMDRDELVGLRDRLEVVIRPGQPTAGPAGMSSRRSVPGDGRDAQRAGPRPRRHRALLVTSLSLLVIVAATVVATQPGAMQALQELTGIAALADAKLADAKRDDAPAARTVDQAAAAPQAPQLTRSPPQLAQPDPAQPQTLASPAPGDPTLGSPISPPDRRPLPGGDQLVRLRLDFDRFLARTEWGSKRLSEADRSRLFNEYLQWNYGTGSAAAGSAPP